MAMTIYKHGQGFWTRVLSAGGAGLLVLSGVAFMWTQMTLIQSKYTLYIQAGSAFLVLVVAGGLLYWVFNKPRVVDFLIATEAEMKKVNWPTRREIVGSTWVVIAGTIMFTVLMALIDFAFILFFQKIHILQS
jgi:preprotein translocase subunit SecE